MEEDSAISDTPFLQNINIFYYIIFFLFCHLFSHNFFHVLAKKLPFLPATLPQGTADLRALIS